MTSSTPAPLVHAKVPHFSFFPNRMASLLRGNRASLVDAAVTLALVQNYGGSFGSLAQKLISAHLAMGVPSNDAHRRVFALDDRLRRGWLANAREKIGAKMAKK